MANAGRRQRETEGERCACSPSNCALRAVAGNERGAMGGGVHSILFVLLLPFLFVRFPSFLLTPFVSLALFTFATSVSLSFSVSSGFLRRIRSAYVI